MVDDNPNNFSISLISLFATKRHYIYIYISTASTKKPTYRGKNGKKTQWKLKRRWKIHIELLEIVGRTDDPGSWFVVHLPPGEAQPLLPREGLLHPSPPLPAHPTRPWNFKAASQTTRFNPTKKRKENRGYRDRRLLCQILEGGDKREDESEEVHREPLYLGLQLNRLHRFLFLSLSPLHLVGETICDTEGGEKAG